MRRLTADEQRIVSAMASRGGTMCAATDMLDHPDAIAIIRSLKSKKRIYEVEDTDLPTFRLTQAGWNDAS